METGFVISEADRIGKASRCQCDSSEDTRPPGRRTGPLGWSQNACILFPTLSKNSCDIRPTILPPWALVSHAQMTACGSFSLSKGQYSIMVGGESSLCESSSASSSCWTVDKSLHPCTLVFSSLRWNNDKALHVPGPVRNKWWVSLRAHPPPYPEILLVGV